MKATPSVVFTLLTAVLLAAGPGCGDDSQCQDLSFAATNSEQVSDEQWCCESGICHVFVTALPGQSTDLCTGCGGIFCAGRCIGCPQC
ncbi:MAG: hypothetical protein JRF54_03590 [Deltaproteobacteria bacterium]|nr:hypothetical protein [Deltaproteobacteria bacterium]MBW2719341.1 hypothetical protein [Deltaproteobacteria bacterium]